MEMLIEVVYPNTWSEEEYGTFEYDDDVEMKRILVTAAENILYRYVGEEPLIIRFTPRD